MQLLKERITYSERWRCETRQYIKGRQFPEPPDGH